MACSIRDCVTHADRFDSLPCLIQLNMVDVVIWPTKAMIVANKRILCCYEVSTPFTEDQLSVLNGVDSTDPSVYIRELKRATRPKCGVHACTVHKMGDLTQPCRIPIQDVFQGELVIDSQSISFKSDTATLDLYHAPQPFTRENLLALNDIDTQEPDAYVRALKRATIKECPFIPIGYESINERIRTKMERRVRVIIPKYIPTTDSENKTQIGAWGRRYRWNSPEPTKK